MSMLETARITAERGSGLRRRRSSTRLFARLGVAAFVVALLLVSAQFAPSQLGGQLSYVITSGESMLPTLRPEGLVITRREGSYAVGDVVAYRDPKLGKVVLHRIIGRVGGRYVLQGDNNQFVDPYHPSEDDIVGEQWLHLPGAGRYLTFLRDPTHFALLIGGIAFLSLRMPHRRTRSGRRRS